ncbi:DNA topoisomerase 3-alpha [Zootermopsis nevadensis]|uniref:DNA topoisomerase 3-alpha n=1 Tax=Zootermopsis nevadensis TaxID=136037 RepID=UPI000B8E31C2|nr:DNA topoisomerase 3-alpha [Zootermopsis nevadensis]
MCTLRLLRGIYHTPTGWRQFHMNSGPILCNKVDSVKQLVGMKILNVAEKNDAAKNLAGYLSGGNIRRREGLSKFNKIYEFECNVFNQRCQMIMTSVSGHLLGLEFVGSYRNWQACNPMALFDAPVSKHCPQDYQQIKRTLEREVRQCGSLIIWTDCDREGENIGFEVIQVCLAVKQNLRVYRAKFSEITAQSVQRALQTLAEPNRNISIAVDVRQELDLRTGAAFTRFQTLRLQKVFPQKLSDALISYGSCQFPTLGFVVERFNAVNNFIPEQFWKIKVIHTINDLSVDFRWKRVHLFDQLSCQVLYEKCMEQPLAKVENVQSKPKSKWRPLPLDTVEMEKLGSRKLKVNAKEIMKIAEKLYTQGFISYPRTETNIFPKELNLRNLIEMQAQDPDWGEFANRILQDGPNPRAGKKSDQAHPPIHPTKHTAALQGDEKRVYEFVVRHFLACCSKDAEGLETVVDIDIAGEKFVANGLMIIARNYLDVYPYEKWSAKEIHVYQSGQTFEPTSIQMTDGETSPPHLLTEADLIALMEKHGIGTDATHAEHIETIKSRMYVGLQNGSHFVPGQLGMGLVEGYDSMGFPMSKPNLRAEFEADLKRICDGIKDPNVVLAEHLTKYKEVFRIALQQAEKIDEALGHYLQETAQVPPPVQAEEQTVGQTVLKCPLCGMDMVLRRKREGTGKFIGFPGNVEDVVLSGESCSECGEHVQKLTFNFRRGSLLPCYPDHYTGCIGGCDPYFLDALDIRHSSVRLVQGTHPNRNTGGQLPGAPITSTSVDSGLGSLDHSNGSTAYSSSVPSGTPMGTNQMRNGSMQGRGRGRGNNRGTSGLYGRATPASNNTVSNHHEDLIGILNVNNGSKSSAASGSGRIRGVLDSGNPHDNAIVCNCNVDAIQLTVRKEGPNKGRPFYKCGKPQGQGCNYFMWADDVENNPSLINPRFDNCGRSNSTTFTSNTFSRPSWEMQATSGPGDDGEVVCQCGMPAKRLTVQKDGPNKGRQFYACQKPQHERCNFFKWADDTIPGDDGRWDDTTSGSTSRGQGAGRRGSKRPGPTSSGPPKKRKCSICKQEGHIRTNCPNK